MAVCVKSHISFLLLLMTEMWEFSSTGELLHFHNNFWNFKISAILGKGKKLSFSFFSFFNWKSNFLGVLSSWEIHLTSWKSPVWKCCQIQSASDRFGLQRMIRNELKMSRALPQIRHLPCAEQSCCLLIELEGRPVISLWQGKYLLIFSDPAFYLQIQSLERSAIRPFVCFFVSPI